MPLYEYQCDACHARFEIIQKFSDPAPDACRACGGGPVRRLLSSPAIQFKGTGWYITDYSQKGKPPAESSKDGAKEGAKEGAAAKDKDAKAPAAGDASATSSGSASSSSAPSPASPTDRTP